MVHLQPVIIKIILLNLSFSLHLTCQVSTSSHSYIQQVFAYQLPLEKKILHQVKNKNLRELQNKAPEYKGFQQSRRQTPPFEHHY